MRTAVGRHVVSGTGSVSPGTEAWEQPALQYKVHAYSPGSAAKFPFSSFVSPGVYETNTVISYVQMRTLQHQATLPRLEC